MSLPDILKEIIAQAQVEVDRINAELEKEKASLKTEADKKQSQAIDQVEAKGKEAAESVKAKMEELARKENNKTRLKAQRGVVDRALEALVTHLQDISDDQYTDFFKKTTASLEMDKGVFHVPSKREKLVSGMCPSGCEVKADKDVKSGFVFKHPRFTVDSTFENLVMAEYRDELEMYFTKQLNLS